MNLFKMIFRQWPKRKLKYIVQDWALIKKLLAWDKKRKAVKPLFSLKSELVTCALVQRENEEAVGWLQQQYAEGCEHLKGGKRTRRRTWMHVDYAITHHTFIDGSRKVWCQYCKKTWVPNTSEWKWALYMLRRTTNTHTSSEIPMGLKLNPNSAFAKIPIGRGR